MRQDASCRGWVGHRVLLGLLLAMGDTCAQAADALPESRVEQSVLKIFTTQRAPSPATPWAPQSTREITGSGVVIEGDRILTNAHVVRYATQVQLQGSNDGRKVNASVVAVSEHIDLALLKVDEPGFFTAHPPLQRATQLPAIRDNVLVYGFPTGGSALSITKGIVSRIEYVGYAYPLSGLRVQLDAAINPGNSGGPALVDDKVIGIAFGVLNNAQNIGYIIPNEEIELFLKDMADGHYDGKPTLYDDMQSLENPGLRAFLKIPPDVHGLVVRRPNPKLPKNPLREWDVITRIGDTAIDDQGMVALEGGLRARFPVMVQRLGARTSVPLAIVRDGKQQKIDMPLVTDKPLLIRDLDGGFPPYFIYGPIAFTRVSGELVAALVRASTNNGNTAALDALLRGGSPLLTRRADQPDENQQELVMVAGPFFTSPLTSGYGSKSGAVVDSINGTRIRSLQHLVEVLHDLKEPFVTIRFANGGNEALVLPRADTVAATEQVLRDNGIRDQASPELLKIWQKP